MPTDTHGEFLACHRQGRSNKKRPPERMPGRPDHFHFRLFSAACGTTGRRAFALPTVETSTAIGIARTDFASTRITTARTGRLGSIEGSQRKRRSRQSTHQRKAE
jgi:hypothetical protein